MSWLGWLLVLILKLRSLHEALSAIGEWRGEISITLQIARSR